MADLIQTRTSLYTTQESKDKTKTNHELLFYRSETFHCGWVIPQELFPPSYTSFGPTKTPFSLFSPNKKSIVLITCPHSKNALIPSVGEGIKLNRRSIIRITPMAPHTISVGFRDIDSWSRQPIPQCQLMQNYQNLKRSRN